MTSGGPQDIARPKRRPPKAGHPLDSAFDFVNGAVGYRFRTGASRKDALARAAGFGKGAVPTIIDATAGLGRDAFLLATLGAQVTLLERSPEVHDLLREALARAAAESPELAAVVARMTLMQGDARELLPGLRADTVIVDPMHPPRTNSAVVKQEMRLLREMVGADPDALELMQAALAADCRRVVLKWPQRAAPLQGLRKPSHSIAGKTVRYDVFMMTGR
ncbi:class I SAM-dependent methyltransferase [Bradyrhizobium sediminis]|uniref:Ribosomal RNA small subunit methyltransferase J n=1 Tax=Bradyrhizobium sediminis TaxID=2840469 RepID=A0A975NNB4_9BRAD|nr:class I SAM-dependent methyltransferase [Bradyrhizobium sediminis]QWG17696.1 class I SAM-dependent methyltransferase [Bradyrhizobium sediminis]